jgi:ribonuclease HI
MSKYASHPGKIQKEYGVLMEGTPLSTKLPNTKKDTKTGKLKCIQINMHHSRLATDNLIQVIEENNIDILYIQEPYQIRNKIVGFPRSLKIFTAGAEKHRAAIVVNNTQLDTILIQQLSDEDAVVLEIIHGNTKLITASLYFDITRQIDTDLRKMEAITQYSEGAGLLIAIDSNSRSSTWHDFRTNRRGKMLEEFIHSQQLYIINEESPQTTFRSTRGSSNIDITVVNRRLLSTVTDWEISDQESCSDHSIIRFDIGHKKEQPKENKYYEVKYITNKEDLKKFKNNLILIANRKLLDKQNPRDPDDLDKMLRLRVSVGNEIEASIDEFYDVLEEACRGTFQTSTVKKNNKTRRTVPWWTEELTTTRKKVNALRRRYQRTREDEDLRSHREKLYTEAKKEYAAKIRKEKSSSWKEFCNMTPYTNPWNEVYRFAAGKRKDPTLITTLRKPDGSLTADVNETLKLMLDHFAPEDNLHEDSEIHKQARILSQQPIYTKDDKEFTAEEIQNIIASLGEKKAPGDDAITAEIYKHTYEMLPNYITALYNGCLRLGVFPTRWKRAKVIPIVKPGRENCEEVSKYRPISLINVGGKVLEKLMINRINYHANSHEFLNTNQYGFTPQRGTTEAAMEVKEYVLEALAAGEIIAIIGLDVKGAFDAAFWPGILNELRTSGCPRNLYNLTNDYFNNRTATLSSNSIRVEKRVTRGCPQGSCSGPGYWNLQYNTLLNIEFRGRTKIVAFADDLILAIKGDTIGAVENYSNGELKKITDWAKRNKITFNEEKSKVMLVSRRKRKDARSLNVYLNNKKLEQVPTMKYLGIIMDQKFKFKEHISYVTEKCTKMIHRLARAAKVSWGIKHEAMKTIYAGAILPLLLYGAPVWFEAMKLEYNKRKFIRIQRLINIRTAKAFRTTSSEALCIIAGVTPITIKIEEAVSLYKARESKTHQTLEIDIAVKVKHWPHPADCATIIQDDNIADSTVQIYSDGSKSEKGVGSGSVIYIDNKIAKQLKFRLHSKCSNNQAEQLAILKAIEEVGTINIPENSPRTLTVLTDSRITIDSLKNLRNHAFLIEEIRKRVKNLQDSSWRIVFKWVKAHAGLIGNEIADKLAKQAAGSRQTDTAYSRIPISAIQDELQKIAIQRWQKEWDNSNKAMITKQYFPSVEQRLKKKIKISQNVTAMLTGHGKTRAYLHRFRISDNATCVCGQEDQTTDHLIYNCSLLETQRRILREKVIKDGQWPAGKQELISKHLEAFTAFIESIDFECL